MTDWLPTINIGKYAGLNNYLFLKKIAAWIRNPIMDRHSVFMFTYRLWWWFIGIFIKYLYFFFFSEIYKFYVMIHFFTWKLRLISVCHFMFYWRQKLDDWRMIFIKNLQNFPYNYETKFQQFFLKPLILVKSIWTKKKKITLQIFNKIFFILLSKQAFTLLKDSQLFPMIIWNFSITFSILSMIIFLSVFLLISCTIFYNVTKCNYKYTSGRKKPIVIKLRP